MWPRRSSLISGGNRNYRDTDFPRNQCRQTSGNPLTDRRSERRARPQPGHRPADRRHVQRLRTVSPASPQLATQRPSAYASTQELKRASTSAHVSARRGTAGHSAGGTFHQRPGRDTRSMLARLSSSRTKWLWCPHITWARSSMPGGPKRVHC